MKYGKLLGLLAVIVILGSITIYFNPSVLNNLPSFSPNSLLSNTQITVDPEGSLAGDNSYTGVYWNLVNYVDAANKVQGFLLPSGQSSPTTIDSIQQLVKTTSSVEVDFEPQQSYLIRDLQLQSTNIYPDAISPNGAKTSSALGMQYYSWLDTSWKIWTPYVVTVKLDGSTIYSGTINANSTTNSASVPTSKGTILITNLGGLQGTYMTPSTPDPIAIFNHDYIYSADSGFKVAINGNQPGAIAGSAATKYSDYWFGVSRDSSNRAINPVKTIGFQQTTLYAGYPGWEGSASGTNVYPVRANGPYSSDKSSLPADKQSAMSLTEWLKAQGNGQTYPNLGDNSLGNSPFSKYGGTSSMSLITDPSTGKAAMKISVPWSAYSTPQVQVRIPVELADTFVERPQTSDVTVHAYWPDGSRSGYGVNAQATLSVDLTQKSSVKSSAKIVVVADQPRFSIYPEYSTETLDSGASKTIQFTISNTGGTSGMDNIKLTINSYDVYSGKLVESDTVYGNALATIGGGSQTTLTVHVVDNSSAHTGVPALLLNVQYPPTGGQSTQAYTNSNGDASFTLMKTGGGGYEGQVYIVTTATDKFPATHVTETVKSGNNEVTIVIGENQEPSKIDLLTFAIIVAIVAVFVGMVALIGYVRKHGKRRRH